MLRGDCEFDIGGFRLRGKRWGDAEGLPVLALHGWLDNCASYDFLAPLLPQLNFVAIDLAGHGLSDHRNNRGAYNIWQDVGEIFAVADQLEWQQFGLIGHSRGAAIAMLAAGTFPERVTRLGLLDGVLPQLDSPENAAANLADSIATVSQQVRRPKTHYASFMAAVKAREAGMLPLCHADALALAERGVTQTPEGYVWSYDNKLVAASEVRLNLSQIEAFVARVEARQLLIMADNSFLHDIQDLKMWLLRHPKIVSAGVPGEHHCHMSTQAQRVADELKRGLCL